MQIWATIYTYSYLLQKRSEIEMGFLFLYICTKYMSVRRLYVSTTKQACKPGRDHVKVKVC